MQRRKRDTLWNWKSKKEITGARVDKGKVVLTIKETDTYGQSIQYVLKITGEDLVWMSAKKIRERYIL